MKSILSLLTIWLIGFMNVVPVTGQQAVLNPEKIYLITDRDYYVAGERIWFEAFVQHNTNQELSKILYLEIFNELKEPVHQQKFKVTDNRATGFIELPDNLYSGNYIIRAYSRFQRNFSPLACSYAMITYLNPKEPLSVPTIDPIDVKVVSHVEHDNGQIECAVYMGDDQFNETARNAWITDSDSLVITEEVQLISGGLASFKLPDNVHDLCYLTVASNNGDTIYKPIEIENSNSNVLEVKENSGFFNVSLSSKESENESYRLLIYDSRGEIFSGKVKVSGSSGLTKQLPKEELSHGFVGFVLQNNQNETVAEQLLLHDSDKVKTVSLELKKDMQPKKRELMISVNSDEISGASNLRIVTEQSLYSATEVVRSLMYNPGLMINTKFAKQLQPIQQDLLLKLNQSEILEVLTSIRKNGNDKSFNPEINGLQLHAITRNKTTQKPVANTPVYLSVLGHGGYFIPQTSDYAGHVQFTLYNLEGEQNIFLTVPGEFKDSVEVMIQNDFANTSIPFTVPPLNLDPSDKHMIESLLVTAQLTNMVGNQNIIRKQPPEFPDKFYGDPKSHVKLKDYIDLPNLEEVFHEIVMNASVHKRKGDPYFVLYEYDNLYSYEDPLVLLDNVPVFNNVELLKIPPSKIEFIDVVNSIYIVGNTVFRGIISMYTYDSDFGGYTFPDEITYIKFLTATSDSYADFNWNSDISYRKPDFRNLVHWDHYVNTPHHLIHLPDNQVTFKVVLRGINADGEILKGEAVFMNKKESHQDITHFPSHIPNPGDNH